MIYVKTGLIDMGTLAGHVAPGLGFLLIGIWHLFNHTRRHAISPVAYVSSPWFPFPVLRHLELWLIMAASSLSISMELFIGPEKHQPFDPDGTIPTNHLHNFEHSSISFSFFTYAAFALLLDRHRPRLHAELSHLLAAMAFAQQLLLFRLHSADHDGVEGQYHRLLQLPILLSLATSLTGIPLPRSFLTSFVRSLSILLLGAWMMVMGFMLWTPALIAKGCWLNSEDGHQVVRCDGRASLTRAKSLVNLQFSFLMGSLSIFSLLFYLAVLSFHGQKAAYNTVSWEHDEHEEEEDDDVESQKRQKRDETRSFLHVGDAFASRDMER